MRNFVIVVLALGASSCQQTNQQAIDAAKPAWATVRSELTQLVPLVGQPAEGRLEGLLYVEADGSKSTVSFLTLEQLGDPDVKTDPQEALGRFDLFAGGLFLHCLQWTGPQCPMSSSALRERRGDRLRDDCALALKTQFLVVLETIASRLPEMTSENTFAGGQATVRVTVIDRKRSRAIATFVIEGKPEQVVRYEVRPAEEKAAKLAAAVHSTMWSNARAQLFEKLRELGAVITLR